MAAGAVMGEPVRAVQSVLRAMQLVEVVVNVPIRRTFSRRLADAPPPIDDFGEAPPADDEAPTLQTFHYHVPPELIGQVQPGHLVWVPFGPRQVQAVVLGEAESSPVPTKPLARLARPEPVLTPTQLELAKWLTHTYVAPISEAIKLFLPPGLLEKEQGGTAVRAKRELQITWTAGDLPVDAALARLGRDTQQTLALAWLLAQPDQRGAVDQLVADCDLPHANAVKALAKKGLVTVEGEQVLLAVDPATAQSRLEAMRGVDKYRPLVETLRGQTGPTWRGDLYQVVDTDLAALRALRDAGLVTLDELVRFRDPLAGRHFTPTQAPPLTGEQAAVWQRVVTEGLAHLREHPGPLDDLPDKPSSFLIHGVTGSGKTEIYLRAIAETLARGRQAVVMVPEIALTPQTVARFAGRFPGRVTVIHSGLSPGERYDVWRAVRAGRYDVVVGPRSALFAPLKRLGLIVMDEEHEPAYKQDAEVWGSFKIFYDARQVARRLADLVGGVVILGSATPSLEAYYAAEQGDLTLLSMPRRIVGHEVVEHHVVHHETAEQGGAEQEVSARAGINEVVGETPVAVNANGGGPSAPPLPHRPVPVRYNDLPPVEVVDMRLELRSGNRSILSRSLQAELHATLDAGQQAILFLNRRGSSTFVMCRDCGDVQECSRCDVPLTYHERAHQLVCHHCNRRYPIPEICPACGSKRIRYFGSGTQRIEDMVREHAPRARVLRWDADTAATKGSHETILRRFANHEADVLVGTQMIAKGLDLPLVTLVGVVAADVGLYLPDFRAGERTFQLLTQVAGRAGRSRHGGRVVVQTYAPDHYVIQAAAQHDYEAFYRREMAYRSEVGYPPLRRMARLVYWDKKLEKAEAAALEMADAVRGRIDALGLQDATVIGPAPAFFARFRGYYRWQLLLLTHDPAAVLRPLTFPFGWRVDIDPVTVL